MIKPNCLYRCIDPYKYHKDDQCYLYHCRNWTFMPMFSNSGITMLDTYFMDKPIDITPENESDFELIFCYDDVLKIPENEAKIQAAGRYTQNCAALVHRRRLRRAYRFT